MSNPSATYGRPGSPEEVARLSEVVSTAFGMPPAATASYVAALGTENLRGFQEEGELAGGLGIVPMGQFFGGRSVRMAGISGVAVAPHARGEGLATRLMTECLRELRASGFPLSGLYPATQPVYRRVGYEQAGARFEMSGPLDALPRTRHAMRMRPFRAEDLDPVQALYTAQARGRPGFLDRGPYAWARVQNFRGMVARGYVAEAGGEIAAYAFVATLHKPTFQNDLLLTDWCARSEDGWRRLVSFLREHGRIYESVTWSGSEADPVLLLLDEQRFHAKVTHWWMLRILDVGAALGARGYPAGLRGEVHLDVSDDLFAENAGRYVLEVSGGEGRVTRGGTGALHCDIRSLAAIYSGHRSAAQLASVSRVRGDAATLAAASELFAGPSPAMVEMF